MPHHGYVEADYYPTKWTKGMREGEGLRRWFSEREACPMTGEANGYQLIDSAGSNLKDATKDRDDGPL